MYADKPLSHHEDCLPAAKKSSEFFIFLLR
jgi:hypothetical protein